VRTPEENALENMADSENMPLDTFDSKSYSEKFAHYDIVITYCNTGNISSQFTKRAHAHGMDNVVNMIGGLSGCKECPKITQK
jgi:rhodanese-related sulfurtransferase